MANGPQAIGIEHHEANGRGTFYLTRDGLQLARLSYARSGAQHITIDHTFVEHELRGLGVARRLLEAAVAWARATRTRVHATCPYARAQLQKNGSLRDIVDGMS